jgi:hypothetical protein
MALAATDLAEIERILAAPEPAADGYLALRRQMPHLAFIRCDAADVAETPFRSFAGYDLHLLDGSDHCAAITADPDRATAIVLARRGNRP